MAIAGNDYEIELHSPSTKLADINRYIIYDKGMNVQLSGEVYYLDTSNLSFEKSDNILEMNRLVTNYTGTLLIDTNDGIDYNKLLPSDLELFSTNSSTNGSDDTQTELNKYNRVVYASNGTDDILKILLNYSDSMGINENQIELYKDNLLVLSIKYVGSNGHSHIITLSSQIGTDYISEAIHIAEDNYTENLLGRQESSEKLFSSGKGIPHYKVSDCNISYIVSDSAKNILAQTAFDNIDRIFNTLSNSTRKICNSTAISGSNMKKFLGLRPQQE